MKSNAHSQLMSWSRTPKATTNSHIGDLGMKLECDEKGPKFSTSKNDHAFGKQGNESKLRKFVLSRLSKAADLFCHAKPADQTGQTDQTDFFNLNAGSK